MHELDSQSICLTLKAMIETKKKLVFSPYVSCSLGQCSVDGFCGYGRNGWKAEEVSFADNIREIGVKVASMVRNLKVFLFVSSFLNSYTNRTTIYLL